MNAFDDIQARFVLGDELSDAEERRLAMAFGVQPGFSERFLRDEQFAGMLTMMGRCDRPDDDFVAVTMQSWDAVSSPEITRPQPPMIPARQTAAILPNENSVQRRPAHRRPTRMPLVGLSVAGAVLILSALLLCTQFVGRDGEVERDRARTNTNRDTRKFATNKSPKKRLHEPPPRNIPEKKPSRIVARLTATQNCRWKSGSEPGTALQTGSLDLLSGVATITFNDGAVVQITGPCRFELQSLSNGYLHHGTVSASVPKPAIGFTVETPIAVIVDLGTEFRVSVEEGGATQVDVTKGAVEYRDRDVQGSNTERKRIAAGESYRVKPAKSGSSTSDSQSRSQKSSSGRITVGTMVINGKTYSFSSQEEYEQLMKKLGRSPRAKP